MEVMFYNRTACESADDSLIELIDYAYRKFLKLKNTEDKKTDEERNNPKQLTAKEIIN